MPAFHSLAFSRLAKPAAGVRFVRSLDQLSQRLRGGADTCFRLSSFSSSGATDAENSGDVFAAALICALIVFPIRHALTRILHRIDAPAHPDAQLSHPRLFRLLFGEHNWDFKHAAPGVLRIVLARFAHDWARVPLELLRAVAKPLGRRLRRWWARLLGRRSARLVPHLEGAR